AEAGSLDEAREGDRRAHRQQGARAQRRGQGVVADVAARPVLEPARRAAVRHEEAEGPHQGAALPRGQAVEHLGAVANEQAAASARRRPPQVTRGYAQAVTPETLDHVALWV